MILDLKTQLMEVQSSLPPTTSIAVNEEASFVLGEALRSIIISMN
jgi:hypothetical protein